MVTPLTQTEIAEFLQMVLSAFDDYIIYAFVLMTVFFIAFKIRDLLVWGA